MVSFLPHQLIKMSLHLAGINNLIGKSHLLFAVFWSLIKSFGGNITIVTSNSFTGSSYLNNKQSFTLPIILFAISNRATSFRRIYKSGAL